MIAELGLFVLTVLLAAGLLMVLDFLFPLKEKELDDD